MEKCSRAELLQILEEQQSKLNRYQTQLKAAIAAYKGLLTEKEALESSLKVLTLEQSYKTETPTTEWTDNSGCKTEDRLQEDQISVEVDSELKKDENNLHHQIKTLSASLTTLTAEKSRIESNFLAERKTLMQEKNELIEQIEKQQQEFREEKENLKTSIQELKGRIREQQLDREKEQRDHALMLRELQYLLSEERNKKESLEQQLEEAQSLTERSKITDKRIEEYERKIMELKQELGGVNDRLKVSEIRVNEPSPILLELRQEMLDMKAQHSIAVRQEQKRANEAEEKLKQVAKISEERIANLEARLSELSQMVGNYDRLQQQDQSAIQKLKERVSQLDMEKNALTRTLTKDKEIISESEDDTNLDVQTLMKRIIKLRKLLKLANQRSERPIDLYAFFQEQNDQLEGNSLHIKCQEELEQLKEEFENYKIRAQSVLKNKNSKDNEYAREVELLSNQNLDLENKYHMSKCQLENTEKQFRNMEESYQMAIQEMKKAHSQELVELNTKHKTKLTELELQLKKQRERTLSLLEEKENEIKLLKSQDPLMSVQNKLTAGDSTRTNQSNQESGQKNELVSELESLTNMLSHSLYSGKNEGHLLHYAHELARKDVEISHLRSARHQAETALRELQQVALTKEEKYTEEIESLCAKIHLMESNQSSEGINMEYLKNVVLRYIICRDVSDKRHILNAIATVLHFTPRELEQVKLFNQTWWWNHKQS